MLLKVIKQTQKKGIRSFASATHVHNPSKPREKWITICPGEGVGPQLIESVLEIFSHMQVPIKHKIVEYSDLKRNQENPDLKLNNWMLLGPVSNKQIEEEHKGVWLSQILNELGTFVTITNPISISGVRASSKDVDLLLIQQNDRGFKGELERTAEYDDISSSWITPRRDTDRFAQYVFTNAVMGRRTKVTMIHQANTHKECHGDLLVNMRKWAKGSSRILYEEMRLGPAASKIAMNPELFDVIAIPNSCDDIISLIAMNHVGGGSLVPTVHIGDQFSIFQQGENDPQYEKVKTKSANPTGLLLSASMMLRQTNLPIFADMLEESVFKTYLTTEARTPDIGGNYSTKEFTKKVMENISLNSSISRNIKSSKSKLEM